MQTSTKHHLKPSRLAEFQPLVTTVHPGQALWGPGHTRHRHGHAGSGPAIPLQGFVPSEFSRACARTSSPRRVQASRVTAEGETMRMLSAEALSERSVGRREPGPRSVGGKARLGP